MATDRTVRVRLDAEVSPFVRGMKTAEVAVQGLIRELDTSSDRTAWMVQSILALGPALVPLGAAAVPALSGLTMQMGLTAGAAATTALAFNGVGEALKAVNDYEVEQTAENLEKMQIELEQLGPAGEDFVRFLDEVGPKFAQLQMVAREGMFPGVEDGITSFLDVLPRVRTVVSGIAEAMGELTSQAGEGLAGEGFRDFFDYLERSAKPLLIEMGQTIGNLIEGLAAMLAAFEPLTADFSQGFLTMSRSFAEWAHGLEDSQSFAQFVAYIESVIPQVKDTLGSLVDALVALVEAAAPIGGVTLHALEGLFDVLALIFRSPAGPALLGAAAGLAAISRAVAVYKTVNGSAIMGLLTGGGREGGKAALGFRTAAAGLGILALSATDLDEKLGVANTAMFAMAGLVAGPWGAAVGAAVGLMLDASASTDDFKVSAEDVISTLNQQTGALTQNTRAWAANELETQGVLRAAQALGLDLDTVTSAALGNAEDIDRVTAAIAAAKAELYDAEGRPIVGAVELGEFRDNMFLVEEGIGETNGALDTAQDRFFRVAEATGKTADETERATTATQEFRDGVVRLNEILSGRASLRAYEQALDDFTARATERADVLDQVADAQQELANVKGNDAAAESQRDALRDRISDLQEQADALKMTLDVTTQAGRDTEALLDNIVAQAIAFAETLQGAERQQYLRQARADFVDTTEKLLGSKKAARELWDELVQLDRQKVNLRIVMDAQDAMRKIGQVRYQMQQLDGDRVTTYVDTVYTASGRRFKDIPSGVPAGADGMTVPGPRLPYGDKTLIFAAPGEEVITNRNGEADRFRADRAAGRIPAYANGGTVAAMTAASRAPQYPQVAAMQQEFDYERLGDELAKLRPWIGNATFNNSTEAFEKQQQAAVHRAANGGL